VPPPTPFPPSQYPPPHTQIVANLAKTALGDTGTLFDINSRTMIARLIELYKEIDQDGDGLIVWDEFTR
jgi:hypothetical protein